MGPMHPPKISSVFFLFVSFFYCFAFAEKKAQAANPGVEIYSSDSFDSEIVQTINPGLYYSISNKPKGPFYQIRLKDGRIGYVPDTDLDIQGEGVLKEKPFIGDEDEDAVAIKNKKKKSNQKNTKNVDEDPDEENSDFEKMSFHGVTLQLINYHEDTAGAVQIGDLYAVGYRNYPDLSDFSSSFSWDVMAAFSAPAYYKELTGQSANGFALWTNFEILNISALGSNTTLHYGAGPFLKYSQFEVKSVLNSQPSSKTKSYTLQDMTVGIFLESGLIFHFDKLNFDLGLRYYWDKKSYGAMTVGLLF
jgi:outer membrane receptor protein involved in Fe transport